MSEVSEPKRGQWALARLVSLGEDPIEVGLGLSVQMGWRSTDISFTGVYRSPPIFFSFYFFVLNIDRGYVASIKTQVSGSKFFNTWKLGQIYIFFLIIIIIIRASTQDIS